MRCLEPLSVGGPPIDAAGFACSLRLSKPLYLNHTRCRRLPSKFRIPQPAFKGQHMATLLTEEMCGALQAIDRFRAALATADISIEIHRDFALYTSIRHSHGDVHLNQAFDPRYTSFSEYDF